MTRNLTTITKWIPLELEENNALFAECKQLRYSAESVIQHLGCLLAEFKTKSGWKQHHATAENEFLIQKLEDFCDMIQNLAENFGSVFKSFHSANFKGLLHIKAKLWQQALKTVKLKFTYFLQELITEIAFLYVYYGEKLLSLTFNISNVYNQCLGFDTKYHLETDMSIICSNTCPYLLYPQRKISVTKLLQILATNRAELCSHKLIDCLLETYKTYDVSDDDTNSDNSSLEIFKAITKHMSPPQENANVIKKEKNISETEDSSCSFVNIEELMNYEEQNVIELLNMAVQLSPTMLGNENIKKSKLGGTSTIKNKAKTKVLHYYQEILWGEVGIFLEHIILWWGASPLAARPPHSSQHLREWITQFLPTINIPPFILASLTTLADALGLHVTTTSWDQNFRLALVTTNSNYKPEDGRLFVDLLQNLVSLINQCETTTDWLLGAPLEELPLVEQVPVLHRLDHSIHTTRLWVVNETKRLANNWNVDYFFKIIKRDVADCLAQLEDLKMRDHTLEIEKSKLDVHVEVCAKLRAKLVSEVNENFRKLKDTTKECVDTMARICRMISLANLQMIFPKNRHYGRSGSQVSLVPSGYVEKYLNEMLIPVLKATDDYHIDNMILKIMCEAWLDHIYINKIKFSNNGACQLLTDFGYVTTWIEHCSIITAQTRKKMLRNEVLRRCEGVGKLLLRSPGDHLKMKDKTKGNESPNSENAELMPPEMYVPNQEQWLELRAHRRNLLKIPICCNEFY